MENKIIKFAVNVHIPELDNGYMSKRRRLKGSSINGGRCQLWSAENSRQKIPSNHLGETRADNDWRRSDTYVCTRPAHSRDIFILLIVMAQAVYATRSCIFMQVHTYVLIHSPQPFANRFWLFITSPTSTDRCHLASYLSVSELIGRFFVCNVREIISIIKEDMILLRRILQIIIIEKQLEMTDYCTPRLAICGSRFIKNAWISCYLDKHIFIYKFVMINIVSKYW